jgi:hypothetical protein
MGTVNPVAGISTLGGVNVGIPGPTVPGVVNATVMVTAPAIIGSVITYGAILMDPEGGAPLIRSLYDSHTHAVLSKDFGITSIPAILFVKGGQVVDKQIGAVPKAVLDKKIQSHL